VKVSGGAARDSKTEAATSSNNGWQEVRYKIWRKKPTARPPRLTVDSRAHQATLAIRQKRF
jgi:hypothetical protein